MSVDVEVIPTVAELYSWAELRRRLLEYPLSDDCRRLVGRQPALIEIPANRIVSDEDRIAPTHRYYFDLNETNTLGLIVERNAETGTEEQEFLDNFARNLSQERRAELAERWKAIGFSFVIGSNAGRSRSEPELLVALCVTVGELYRGQILIQNSKLFSLPVGCYAPSEFRSVKPKFFLR